MITHPLKCDVVIFGGGVAGLWLLAELRQQGYQVILIENDQLGAGQTRFAQGIIHGGTKYALLGKITASSEAISAMPAVWRDCINGKGVVDLTKVKVLADNQCMWSTAALSSKLAGFFASKLMRSRTDELVNSQRPEIFQNKKFKGKVYKLDEPVLDTASIVSALAEPHIDAIMHSASLPQWQSDSNTVFNIDDANGQTWQIQTGLSVLAAGQGNAAILDTLGMQQPQMQLRPLKMVMLRGALPEKIYAHCLEANVNPRVTITSHEDAQGEIVWYMGGQLAEEGINSSDSEQVDVAKKELAAVLPWLDFSKVQWACLDINRAEPQMEKGKRPDTSFIAEQQNIITAWPTKLALAPKLAKDITEKIIASNIKPTAAGKLPAFPHPDCAVLPWQEEQRWK